MVDFQHKPVLKVLQDAGIELDQRMQFALNEAARVAEDDALKDRLLLWAITKSNSSLTRHLSLTEREWRVDCNRLQTQTAENLIAYPIMARVLNRAIARMRSPGTLGTSDVLLALLEDSAVTGDSY